jgi:hypothetical protein
LPLRKKHNPEISVPIAIGIGILRFLDLNLKIPKSLNPKISKSKMLFWMKKCLLVITAALIVYNVQAQVTSYDLSAIPDVVKKDADVVKRYEDILFEVTDIDRAVMKVHQLYTILNEDGKYMLNFHQYTSKFTVLGDVDIKVFDAGGKQVLRYKKKDLASIAIGEGLIDDGKTYYVTLPASTYPVTVEYEYELRFKGTINYPPYRILLPGQGVEASSFTAKIPKELDIRYKENNISLKPVITQDDKYKFYKWSVKNLAPVKYEQRAVTFRERYPCIKLAPNKFQMDDYQGDMSSWKNFGIWYSSLIKGIDVFPEAKKEFFRKMVANVSDDREKVKIIYGYLQKNFRYVSIQLGIGGFKPFPASFTDDKKYGDCKGLSNYIHAALDAVGIKSYLALINRESDGVPVDPAFPCNEFNHAILMAPLKKDTLWLECTSNTLDFGMLDISTENRYALVITDDGGMLVPTPATRADENIFSARTNIDLQASGEGKILITFTTAGEYKEEMRQLLNAKTDDQKEYIVHRLGFRQPDDFVLTKKEENYRVAALEMLIEKVPEFIAGNKMFISPRIYKFCQFKLPDYPNRKQDFYFDFPLFKTDTTVFKLPAGASVDVLPKPKDLSSAYATYTTKYWYNETEKAVYATASLILKSHKIPAAGYAEIKKFFDEILMDDTQKIVVKKE